MNNKQSNMNQIKNKKNNNIKNIFQNKNDIFNKSNQIIEYILLE